MKDIVEQTQATEARTSQLSQNQERRSFELSIRQDF